jgi:hypothetical protein
VKSKSSELEPAPAGGTKQSNKLKQEFSIYEIYDRFTALK